MAVTLLDGPLGREATHTWTPAVAIAGVGSIVLNAETGFPRFEIDKIRGWRKRADADDNRAPLTGRHGEVPYPSFRRGKTLVYEGRLVCATLPQLRAYTTMLNAGFYDQAEGAMVVAPHPSYGSVAWHYHARVIDLDIDEEDMLGPGAAPTRFQLPGALSLRLSDARFYLHGDPVETGPHADGATVAVTNQGLAPTERFTIAGDISGTEVLLENLSVPTSNGTARLRLDTNYLGATLQEVTVGFGDRSIAVTTGGADPYDGSDLLDTSYSQWWDEFIDGLVPGVNQIKVTGLENWTTSVVSATP